MFGLQPPGNLKGSSREDQVNRAKRAARQRRFSDWKTIRQNKACMLRRPSHNIDANEFGGGPAPARIAYVFAFVDVWWTAWRGWRGPCCIGYLAARWHFRRCDPHAWYRRSHRRAAAGRARRGIANAATDRANAGDTADAARAPYSRKREGS